MLLGAIAFALLGGRGPASLPQPSTSPVAVATPTPEPTPFRPRATPPGTPAPRPSTFVLISSSIPVKVPPAPNPTATPEPGLWRLEGYVVDEQGQPIENVCVVIGPVGCQTYTTKTDERGHWFLDIASGAITPLTLLAVFVTTVGRGLGGCVTMNATLIVMVVNRLVGDAMVTEPL